MKKNCVLTRSFGVFVVDLNLSSKKYMRLCCLVFFMTLGFIAQVSAQEKLSLNQALRKAFESNPDVIEARQNIEMAKTQLEIDKKWQNPELEVAFGNLAKDLEGEGDFSTRDVESEVTITQPINSWGKKRLKKRIMRQRIKQQEFAFKSVWARTAKEVKSQYTKILLNQKAVNLAEENLNLTRKFLDQTKIKFDSGEVLNHQLSRAKLEVIQSRNQLLIARKDWVVSMGKLNLLLGQPVMTEYEFIDTFKAETLDSSYDKLLDMALNESLDLFIQRSRLDQRNEELKLAKREKWPDWFLSLFVEREDEIYKGGVGISFELPLWNMRSNEVKQAELQETKARQTLKRMEEEVTLELYTSFHEARLAKSVHEVSIEAIKEANEILRLTTLGYEEGEISFLNYLENIKTYKQTKQQYYQALFDYTVKIAQLEQVVGTYVVP